MSIIYDALAKTQKNIERGNISLKQIFSIRFGFIILLICTLAVLVSSIFYIFSNTHHKSHRTQPIKSQPTSLVAQNQPAMKTPPKPYVPLNLTGVFLSEHDKIALINNQSLHLGDEINGQRIISIDADGVKLKQDQNVIFLRTTS